ncbi:MAG: class I SAM-dependent methyltransferase [Phycisphaerales bacterium]|nr:class I SAM-dependent methyltransferase [Phycisphaerales bacterium]
MATEQETGPLHELDPTGRFSDRAGDYVRFRPSYPSAAINALLTGLGDPGGLTAADVGAGTGISTRLLADRGVRVRAVEPNAAMREAAAVHPRITWIAGTAEDTTLESRSVELVLCAQAFHWFKPDEALAEFARILTPGGRLALMWNQRDDRDPLTHGYIETIRRHGGEHPAETRSLDDGAIERSGVFGSVELFKTPYEQPLGEEALLGRARSASYVPKSGPAHERIMRELRELHRSHAGPDGIVMMKYQTVIYMAAGACA